MFVYEPVNEKWISKLQRFSKPLYDGLQPSTHWHYDNEKDMAIFYIGWVTPGILRLDGETMYEFAIIHKDECVLVTAYIFSKFENNKHIWNDRNRLLYRIPNRFNSQLFADNVKTAILHYLNNIYNDR